MQELPEKYKENVKKAIDNIRIADHMLYVTYPVIKDKRLLIKTLEQVYDSIICIINSILQYDHIFKRVKLTNDARDNFEIFLNKCTKRYNITEEEISSILELITLVEKHKKSPVEFIRRDKIVIMEESLKTTTIDSESLKKYLVLAKNMVNKAKFGMSLN